MPQVEGHLRICLGVNALRARSGGAIDHVVSLLSRDISPPNNVERIVLWTNDSVARRLPKAPWLTVVVPSVTRRSVARQLVWEARSLPAQLQAMGCHVVFNVDAGSLNSFSPSVTLSQDLLPFEDREARRFGLSRQRARLLALRQISKRAFLRSDVNVFLTKYAEETIRSTVGVGKRTVVIPHGVDSVFGRYQKNGQMVSGDSVRIIYVSETSPYKHQLEVLQATELLMRRGYSVSLTFVGGCGNPKYDKQVRQRVRSLRMEGLDVRMMTFVDHDAMPRLLSSADIFLFASSCESLPITLLEAMAVGLPIACSERGPMREVGKNAMLYFDPESPESIRVSLEQLITNAALREELALAAHLLSQGYTWDRCAMETFDLLVSVGCEGVNEGSISEGL